MSDEIKVPEDDFEGTIENLKRQLEQEKTARLAAEGRAGSAANEVARAEEDRHSSELALVSNAINTVNTENAALKARYSYALREQDFDLAAEIQAEMATNSAKLLRLEEGKAALENNKPSQQQNIRIDPVDQLASQLTPRSAAWVRSHPEYARDPNKYQGMLGAHNVVVSMGIVPDTDEYFDRIESVLGIRDKIPGEDPIRRDSELDGDDPSSMAAQPVRRRDAQPPAAPSSSSSGSSRSVNNVRLTAAQKEAAESSGLTYEEYAKNLVNLRKEGKVN